MKRKLLIASAAVVILGVAVAGWVQAWGSASRQSTANPGLPPATAMIIRTTLVETRTLPGTLGYGDPVPVSATVAGMLTRIAPVGSTVERGEPLFEVDGRPVVVLYGPVPLYRTLRDGAESVEPQMKVAEARATLRDAEDALAKVKTPPSLHVAQAEAKVADARLVLKGAKEALDAVNDSPGKAQDVVDSARVTLVSAEGDLKLTRNEWGGKLDAARKNFSTALEGYRGVFKKWLGIELGESDVDTPPDSLLAFWNADLDEIFKQFGRYPDLGRYTDTQGAPSNDPSTKWNETTVYIWLNFYVGTIAPTCEDDVIPVQGACVQKEMDDAWDAYQQARNDLDTVETQGAKAIANAEGAVTRARQSLATAEDDLAVLEAGPDPLEVDQAEKQLTLAQINLDVADEDLAKLKGNPDPLAVALRESEVAAARLALDNAILQLAAAMRVSPMSGADVQQIQKNLAELGYSGFAVDGIYTPATAQAVRVWQADLGLPETGTVEPGQVVFTPGTVRIAEHAARVGDILGERGVPVLTYTDTTRLVTVDLDVTNQALAVEGRKVTVTVPGREDVEGEISRVGTVVAGGANQGNARIEVTVTIADQDALGSLDAAPVDVDFVSEERKDVLAAPVAALLALAEGGFGVEIVDGNTTRIVPVKTGMFAAGRVEVSGEGIAEGVTVGVPK